MVRNSIEKFADIVKSKKKITILLHNNPDPDSIASALALKHIVKAINNTKAVMVYGGIIGRAENQEMIRLLKVNLMHISNVDLRRRKNIIMLDTQPSSGNNSLPEQVIPDIVIDHHPLKKKTMKSPYYDIREGYGSTCSIILEYIKKLNINVDKNLATALFYGIKTDIDDIGRDRTKEDNEAMIYLYPLISPVTLSKIQHPRIPVEYFIWFFEAMNNAYLVRDTIISDLKGNCTPDMIAEMSDFFLKMKGIRWVMCIGTYKEGIYFSIRTTSRSLKAGKIAIKVIRGLGAAGGHHKSAGGYISVTGKAEEVSRICDLIKTKFLKSIKRAKIPYRKIIKEEKEDAKI